MTITELREHPDYKTSMEKVIAYRPGFTFRMDWTQIPTAKGNALKILLNDAIEAGYLESAAMEYDLEMNLVAERYKRTEKLMEVSHENTHRH